MRRLLAGIVLSVTLVSPLLGQRPIRVRGTAAQAGQWRAATTRSEMTGQSGLTLTLNAVNMVEGVILRVRPSLIIRCHERELNAYIWTGSVLDGGIDGAVDVRLRWDTLPPEADQWSRSTDLQAAFAPDPDRLVQRILASAELRLEFHPYDAAPRVAVFRPGGLARYIAALRRACPNANPEEDSVPQEDALLGVDLRIRPRQDDDSVREAAARSPAPFVAPGDFVVGQFQPTLPGLAGRSGYTIRGVPPAVRRLGLSVGDLVLGISRSESSGADRWVQFSGPVIQRLGGWQAAWMELAPADGDTVQIEAVHRGDYVTLSVRHRETPAFRTARVNHAVTRALLALLASRSGRADSVLAAIDSLSALRRRAASSPVVRQQLRGLERLANRDSIVSSFQAGRRTP